MGAAHVITVVKRRH